MSDFSIILNVLLGGGIVAMITAAVAALRKYKAGEIVDDDAVIGRLDKDNTALRGQLRELQEEFEAERRRRWRAEDLAAGYRRRLTMHEEVEEHE